MNIVTNGMPPTVHGLNFRLPGKSRLLGLCRLLSSYRMYRFLLDHVRPIHAEIICRLVRIKPPQVSKSYLYMIMMPLESETQAYRSNLLTGILSGNTIDAIWLGLGRHRLDAIRLHRSCVSFYYPVLPRLLLLSTFAKQFSSNWFYWTDSVEQILLKRMLGQWKGARKAFCSD